MDQPQAPRWSERFTQHVLTLEPREKAILRRSLAHDPGTHTPSFGVIERWVPKEARRSQRDAMYLVAGLIAHCKTPQAKDRSLGAAAAKLRDPKAKPGADPIERRFRALLESDTEALPYTLRRFVILLDSKSTGLDWERLLRDVERWGHPNSYVQQAWARDFYRAPTTTDTSEETTSSEQQEQDG